MYPQRGLNYFSSLDGNTGMYSSFDGLDSITKSYEAQMKALGDMQRLASQETETKNAILKGFSSIASIGGGAGGIIGSAVDLLAMSDEDRGSEAQGFAQQSADIQRKFQQNMGTALSQRNIDAGRSIYGGLAGNGTQLQKIQLT